MDILITAASVFERDLKRLAKRYASMKQDYAKLLRDLRENPRMGKSLGGKLRKVRMPIASKGKGKSGGARVITYTIYENAEGVFELRLLDIYDKGECSTMTDKELEALVKACGL